MTDHPRCTCCQGSGKMIGGGMLRVQCSLCEGSGKIIPKAEIDYSKVKDTNGYKSAKARLKDKDKSLTDEQAEKILDNELKKEIT